MSMPWTTAEFAVRVREWCNKVAELGVDEVVRAGLLPLVDFKRATDLVAEEIFVRLCLDDYPPREAAGTTSS